MAGMALVAMALVAPAQAAPEDNPKDLIESVAQQMLKDLEANRADYRKNPAKLNTLVDKVLLPHFDVDEAAKQVLGQYRKEATPQQVQRFTKALYTSLVQTYATALLDFTSDKLQIKPFRGDAKAERATVQTVVKRSDGTRVAVDYAMRKTPQGWKAWDVKVEGISYVKNFRDDYGPAIQQKGLEPFIVELETRGVKKPAAAK
jgi:phospholipid transport system substrate-binding protein